MFHFKSYFSPRNYENAWFKLRNTSLKSFETSIASIFKRWLGDCKCYVEHNSLWYFGSSSAAEKLELLFVPKNISFLLSCLFKEVSLSSSFSIAHKDIRKIETMNMKNKRVNFVTVKATLCLDFVESKNYYYVTVSQFLWIFHYFIPKIKTSNSSFIISDLNCMLLNT